MKRTIALLILISFALICLVSCNASLGGKWELDENGAVFDFANDGKLTVSITIMKEEYFLGEGKYSVDGDKMTVSDFVFADFDKIADESVKEKASEFITNFIETFGSSVYKIEKNLMTLAGSNGKTAIFEKN